MSLVEGSARGLTIPKAPPAFVTFSTPEKKPAALFISMDPFVVNDDTYRSQKVTSRKKNREIKAIEDRRQAMRKIKVTIPHAER